MANMISNAELEEYKVSVQYSVDLAVANSGRQAPLDSKSWIVPGKRQRLPSSLSRGHGRVVWQGVRMHATIRQECIMANQEDERSYLREEFRGAAFRGGLR